MSPTTLDETDLRIVGALQVDARASWRKIAAVLGQPERTVARRGSELLSSGAVVVSALRVRGRTTLLRGRTAPGSAKVSATTLAQRADTSFVFTGTGPYDCIAEFHCTRERLPALMLDELPGVPGLHHFELDPVLRYYRIVDEWQPVRLDPAEVDQLRTTLSPPNLTDIEPGVVPRETSRIMAALAEDGRQGYDDLGRVAGVSEATARRRVASLRAAGRLYIRAVVEPELVGLPVEAILWVRAAPGQVDQVGNRLLDSPYVRYAAAVTGPYQLVVNTTLPSMGDLYAFVSQSPYFESALSVETSLVVDPVKRSGVLTPALRR